MKTGQGRQLQCYKTLQRESSPNGGFLRGNTDRAVSSSTWLQAATGLLKWPETAEGIVSNTPVNTELQGADGQGALSRRGRGPWAWEAAQSDPAQSTEPAWVVKGGAPDTGTQFNSLKMQPESS